MADRTTAEQRLERILYLLPAATTAGGADLAELAAALGVTRGELLRDIEEITAREFYHPAGTGDDIQIQLEPDRVTVRTTGEFRWPARLSAREALALGLGLRALAGEVESGRRAALLELASRLEAELAVPPAEAHSDAGQPADIDRIAAVLAEGDEDVLSVLVEGARERRVCRMRYMKPGDAAPTERRVHPYTLAFAEGVWYVLGHAEMRGAVRVFRVDRVLAAALEDPRFEVPDTFDPAGFIAKAGMLFRAEDDVGVAVRYSPRIARWLAERLDCEPRDDGSVVVRHRVADPRWLVRHVLQYGGEAVVLEDAGLRAHIGQIAEGLAG